MSPATKPTTKSTTVPTNQASVQAPQTDVTVAEAKQNRQFMIIMISIMVAIIFIGGYISVKLVKSYIHKTDQIKAEDKYIHALEQKQQDLQELQQNYQTITAKGTNNLSTADLIYHALPLKAEFKSLIGVIENIGNESGIKPSVTSTASSGATAVSSSTASADTSQSTAQTGSSPVPFGFAVSVTSNYDQLINFLQGTERSLRPMSFLSMNISGAGNSIQSTIQFNTYYQGEADISNKQEPLK